MQLPFLFQYVLLCCVGWVNRWQQEVIEYQRAEIRALREQLGPGRIRFTDAQRRRLAAAGKLLGGPRLAVVATLARPATILGWYRELVAAKYSAPRSERPARRRRTAQEIAALVVRLARENAGWGYTRIRDALKNVQVSIGRSTVKRILDAHGIEPAPERCRRGPTWAEFLGSHLPCLAAADFFTVEVLTWKGLVRYQVFFVMHLATRRVEIAGITANATGAWLQQIGRNLLDPDAGFLRDTRYLILDRDPLYTAAFRKLLASSGVKLVRLPRESPNLNAYASHCTPLTLAA